MRREKGRASETAVTKISNRPVLPPETISKPGGKKLAKTDTAGTAARHPEAKPETKAKSKSPARPRRSRSSAADAARIHEIFTRFSAVEPHPKGELEHVNVFTFLVAVVLSAQATDVGVNKATRALFAVADTPQKMLELGEERVRDMIKTIGLFRAKAKNVILLSEKLLKDFGGKVPETREELETLPGVGRKTANVVMNNAFGAPTIAVDTHLFRVSNRIPLAKGKTPLAVELGLEKVIPDEFKLHAHHWLILHGRYICKARRPECERCIISDLCSSPEKRV
jgi:endonuclease-3